MRRVKNTRRTPLKWTLALPLLLLTAALGLRDITAHAIWLDETWSVYNAGGAPYGTLSPIEIIQRVATEDPRNAAPLYHLILGGWGALAGWSAFAMRYSSLLFGMLAVAWTYRLGRDMVSPLAGLGAAAVLSSSALFIYFTHELRTYMLATLFVPMAVACYWRLLRTKRITVGLRIGFVIGLLGLLYTHYLAAVTGLAIGLYHLLFVSKTRRWWMISGLMGLAGLLFLPWLGVVAAGMQLNADQAKDAGVYTVSQTLEKLVYFFGNGAPFLVLVVLVLMVVRLGLWERKEQNTGLWAAVFIAGVSVVGVVSANAVFHLIQPGRERYMLMLWPLIAIAISPELRVLGTEGKKGNAIRYGVFAVAIGVWMVVGVKATLDGTVMRDIDGANALPWDVLARTLATDANEGDTVAVEITTYNWALEVQTADYYLRTLPVRWTLMEQMADADLSGAVQDFVKGTDTLWVGLDKRLPSLGRYDEFVAALETEFIHCGVVFDVPLLRLDVYKHLPETAVEGDAIVARFGDGISLTYADMLAPQEGQPLRVLLTWALDDAVPRGTYSVALHVVDGHGNIVAQMDYGLPDESLACRQTETSTEGLPAGEYRLMGIVYNWATGERLMGTAADAVIGEQMLLGTFEIKG